MGLSRVLFIQAFNTSLFGCVSKISMLQFYTATELRQLVTIFLPLLPPFASERRG